MGKIYNIQLNSENATTVATAYSNVTYNISWNNLLPQNKKFKVTFAFMGGLNYGNNSTFPSITTNLLANTYRPVRNGFQNSYYLGQLRPIPVSINAPTSGNTSLTNNSYVNYTAAITDNDPIYLDNRPMDNNLQVIISNGTGTSNFQGNYLTAIGQGNCRQSGNILTVVQVITGQIAIGTNLLTLTGTRVVLAFITGTGGLGTYLVDTSQTQATNLFFSYVTDATREYIAPYILNLSFEEQDE